MAGGEVKVKDEEMMVQGDLVPAVGADQVSLTLTLCLCLELRLSFGSFVLLYPCPEVQKPKTFRVVTFHAQKISG